jgi:hypothetical protein
MFLKAKLAECLEPASAIVLLIIFLDKTEGYTRNNKARDVSHK